MRLLPPVGVELGYGVKPFTVKAYRFLLFQTFLKHTRETFLVDDQKRKTFQKYIITISLKSDLFLFCVLSNHTWYPQRPKEYAGSSKPGVTNA